MAKVYDVIVVGAGPAGCIAAKELARSGLKVLLLESKKIPRHKPCAGGLMRKTLSLLDPSSLPALCKIEEIAVSFRRKTFKPVKAPLATVERSNLDAQLAYQAVRAGAELHDGEPVTNVNRGGMRTKTGTYRARVIIGADGANSLVARLSGLGLPLRGIALETVVSWNGPGERILVELGAPPGGTPGSFRAPGEKLR